MAHNRKEIPYFIQIEGCNKCKVHEAYTTDTGTFYEQVHPLHAKCVQPKSKLIHLECELHTLIHTFPLGIKLPYLGPD